MLGHHQNRC